MAVYKLGSRGDEVLRLQERLTELGHYRGPHDGDFGGGTDGAVRAFQRAEGLEVDGKVGPDTWKALFDGDITEPALAGKPLIYRCLAMTGSFETSTGIPDCFAGLHGDFDGQGISYGVLQWNFGQNTLQPLLKEILSDHPDIIETIFHDHTDTLKEVLRDSRDEQLAFARSIQHAVKHSIHQPWRGMFKALGRTAEFQDLQVKYADRLFQTAREDCNDYHLWTERAVALMFDIRVQNGSIPGHVQARIMADFKEVPKVLAEPELEVRMMRIVANRRAEAAKPRWVEDVRARKLCIANGEGEVHGIHYDLGAQYGLGLRQT